MIMATLSYPRALDTAALATGIKGGFDLGSLETSMVGAGSGYTIKARKSSWFRAIMAADRALEVTVCTRDGSTQVVVSQGDWTTNLLSNLSWFLATEGANLGISAW